MFRLRDLLDRYAVRTDCFSLQNEGPSRENESPLFFCHTYITLLTWSSFLFYIFHDRFITNFCQSLNDAVKNESSLGLVTMVPCTGKRLFSSTKRLEKSRLGLPSHLFNGYRGSFPDVERTERDIDHSSPSSAEVNKWSCASISPRYLNGLGHGQLYCWDLRCSEMLRSVYW